MILLRGTWIILKFVKDKDNLLNYNQWSCGDFEGTIVPDSKSPNMIFELTDDYKSNGNYSIKLQNETTGWEWSQLHTYDEYQNVSRIQIQLDYISNQNFRVYAVCKYNQEPYSLLDYVIAPSSDEFQTVIVTSTVDPTKIITSLGIRTVLASIDTVTYIDNVSIKIL